MLATVCSVAFIVTFLLNTIAASFWCKLTSYLPISKNQHEEASLFILRVFWSLSFLLSPWISLTRDPTGWDGWEDLRQKVLANEVEAKAGKAKHKPVFVFSNHTSFMDTPLGVTIVPFWLYMRCRTYVASFLFKMPVFATIVRSLGHFPVYFVSNEEGKFKVDPERMKPVEERADKFFDNGGCLCFFPEGTINKNPDRIQPFRYGGVKKALEKDVRIAMLIYYGNPKVWPAKTQIAGYPAKVKYGGRVLALDGAQAYVKALRDAGQAEDERDLPDHVFLGKRLEATMQEMYDGYKADVEGTRKKD